MQGIVALVQSAKASVLLVVLGLLFVLVLLGRLDVERFMHAVELLTPAWMLAHAGQSSVEAMAARAPSSSSPPASPPAAGDGKGL